MVFRKKDFRKVYYLQYKILISFEARNLFVRNVTTRIGKNTLGVDKITWKRPLRKYKVIAKLKEFVLLAYKYGPSNIKRIWISKPYSDDLRPLVVLAFDPIVEEINDLYSFGSRKYRGPYDAMRRLKTFLGKSTPPPFEY